MLLPKDFSLTGDEAEEVVVPPPALTTSSLAAAGASGTASAAAASYLAARAATASSTSSVSAAAATRTTSETTTTPRPLPRSQPIEAQAIVRSRHLNKGEILQVLLEIRATLQSTINAKLSKQRF